MLHQLPAASTLHHLAEAAELATERATELNQRLARLGRTETTRDEQVDLTAALTEAVSMMRQTTPPNVKFDLVLTGAVPPAQGDVLHLRRVLLNVIKNAVEALPESGGTVRVELQSSDAKADRLTTRSYRLSWAVLLARIFSIDACQCECGGRMKTVAAVTDPASLHHLLQAVLDLFEGLAVLAGGEEFRKNGQDCPGPAGYLLESEETPW